MMNIIKFCKRNNGNFSSSSDIQPIRTGPQQQELVEGWNYSYRMLLSVLHQKKVHTSSGKDDLEFSALDADEWSLAEKIASLLEEFHSQFEVERKKRLHILEAFVDNTINNNRYEANYRNKHILFLWLIIFSFHF